MYNIWKWASLILIPNTLIAIYTMRWVIHTHEVKEQLMICMSDIRDAETGVRGFMASKGDEKFLEPYYKALPQYSADIDRVQSLTLDNINQQRKIPLLRKLTREKFDILGEGVEYIRKGDFEKPSQLIRAGLPVMTEVRNLIRDMNFEEDRLLSMRAEKSKYSLMWMTGSVVVLFAALIVQASIDFSYRLSNRRPKELPKGTI